MPNFVESMTAKNSDQTTVEHAVNVSAPEIDKETKFFEIENVGTKFYPFRLSDDFVSTYSRRKVPWGPLGEFTYLRTYARWIDEDNEDKRRLEHWHDTVRRVVEGVYTTQKKHCYYNRLPWDNAKSQKSAKTMYDLIFHMKFLPPGRGLWMMGTEYVEKKLGACLNNCGFVSTKNLEFDPIRPFQFVMDLSMLGVGVGFDTNGKNRVEIQKPKHVETVAAIPDSREGWIAALGIVLSGFFRGTEIPKFDYSLIRDAGTPIKGFGGTSSGPEPLKKLLGSLQTLLTEHIGEKLTSVLIVDIMDYIGKCVVSGNVRRTALLGIGNSDDKKFIELKNPKLYAKELKSHRWASNNSVFCEVGQNYEHIAELIKENGEPGVIWLDNMRKYGRMSDGINNADYRAKGVNPCGEQILESMELCNLVETFPSLHESYEEYEMTLKYAYLYAKTVTLIPTHWEETNAVLLRNRRIGTSQSGIVDACVRHGRQNMIEWCEKGYSYLRKVDGIYSDWLCIPRSIKITTVKPSGSVSLLPGVSPGIHYPHSQYYIRRVRVSKLSLLVKIMKDAGYKVEADVSEDSSMIVEFPVAVENFVKGKEEVTMWEQLLNAADWNGYWSDNNISITVTFKPEEARDIANALSIFDSRIKAATFLPLGNKVYPQMPYEAITEAKYKAMVEKLSKPDYSEFMEEAVGEKFCDGETCQL